MCYFYHRSISGTESSQSSDDGFSTSHDRAVARAIQKTFSGVPTVPSQLITASQSATIQAMTSTASSESELSSSELQVVKESNVVKIDDQEVVFPKEDKRPSQKVPKLSSRKLAQIKVCVFQYVCECGNERRLSVCIYVREGR